MPVPRRLAFVAVLVVIAALVALALVLILGQLGTPARAESLNVAQSTEALAAR